jgi:hypothetical protein
MPQQNNGAPSLNATSYDVDSAKAANLTQSIANNDLNLGMASSSSAFVEDQALFNTRANIAASTLVNVGDYIDFMMEFTDTLNLIGNGATASANQLNIGLFDSDDGTPPNPGNLSTMSYSGATTGWQGYYSDLIQFNGSSNSKLFYRPIQNTGTGNTTLTVSSGINGGYGTPVGVQLVNGSLSSTLRMTNGAQYTEDFRITLNAPGTLMVSNELFAGIGVTGTVEYAFGGYTNAVDSSFDAMAFSIGDKQSVAMTQDISFIQITTDVVPEPSTWLLIASGFGVLLALVSRRRR